MVGPSSHRGSHPVLQPLPVSQSRTSLSAHQHHLQDFHPQTLSNHGRTTNTAPSVVQLFQPLALPANLRPLPPSCCSTFLHPELYFSDCCFTVVFLQAPLTLRSLWSHRFQVIVSYQHGLASGHSHLWTHIPYWWANKSRADHLIQELELRKQQGRPGEPPIPTLHPSIH